MKKHASRGALKLKGLLKQIDISFKDKVILDIGASHGGFTETALLNGASLIYAVDVSKGLLDCSLRNFNNIVIMDNTNAKYLTSSSFSQVPQISLIDVSFISIKNILPVVFEFVTETILALIKPQFEATYAESSKGNGIIDDVTIHNRIIDNIKLTVTDKRWDFIGTYPSAIRGRKGNQEYFLYYERV